MFGKRSTPTATPAPPPERASAPEPSREEQYESGAQPAARLAESQAEVPQQSAPRSTPTPPTIKTERKHVESARSEEYYDVKTTVFNALIDTIDKATGKRLLKKSAYDNRSFLSLAQVKRVESLARELGIKLL